MSTTHPLSVNPSPIPLIPILNDAIGLLQKGHAKGTFARDARGTTTGFASPNATCWCAMGAVRAALVHRHPHVVVSLDASGYYHHLTNEGEEVKTQILNALNETVRDLGHSRAVYQNVLEYNDTHTQEEVIEVFRTTIIHLSPVSQ